MSDSTKALIGSIFGMVSVVATFAIMSDCSKHIADVEADPRKACLEAGGYWSPGVAANQVGRCIKIEKKETK